MIEREIIGTFDPTAISELNNVLKNEKITLSDHTYLKIADALNRRVIGGKVISDKTVKYLLKMILGNRHCDI